MSDKYPNLSPYVYCADNPVKLIDPNGDSIKTMAPDNYKGNNIVLKSLSEKTGLNLCFSNGILKYGKDNKGNAISTGGSESARNDLIKAIDDKTYNVFITYFEGSKSVIYGLGDYRQPNMIESLIRLDLNDFTEEDDATFDIGMCFLHEFQHSYFGKSDTPSETKYDINKYITITVGPTVDRVNQYRKELGLPLRDAYNVDSRIMKLPFKNSDGTIKWINIVNN